MSAFLGPLDAAGRVPLRQQTHVATFLVSCHGALARQLAINLAWQTNAAWHAELNTQLYRESEFVSLLLRATSWTFDPELMFLLPLWEVAWLPKLVEGIPERVQALTVDMAALGHALHGAIRPAALLPDSAPSLDPFALALRKIELESNRLIQTQILFLKSADLLPFRGAVNAAVENRHAQVRKLWNDMLSGIGVERSMDR
jgi:hypothetical protein